jgi:hypothetical protein
MPWTDKQRKIISMSMGLKKRVEGTKDFMQILEEKVTGSVLTGLVTALKAELVAQKTAASDEMTAEIAELTK